MDASTSGGLSATICFKKNVKSLGHVVSLYIDISLRVGDPSYEEYCFERDEASMSLCEIHIPDEQDAQTTCK